MNENNQVSQSKPKRSKARVIAGTLLLTCGLGGVAYSGAPWIEGFINPKGVKEMQQVEAASPEAVTVTPAPAPSNYTADDASLPEGVDMDSIDLSGISPGGGLPPEQIDWSNIGPSTLRIPEANLSIPWVTKSIFETDAGYYEMELPVGFQAGWLDTSAPVGASEGTTTIAGHINYGLGQGYTPGSYAPMSNLYFAKAGMTVQLTDENGNLTEWVIVDADPNSDNDFLKVDQDELSATVSNLQSKTGPRELILITCDGDTNPLTGVTTYTDNRVLKAVPKQ